MAGTKNTIENEQVSTGHYTVALEKTLRTDFQGNPLSWHYSIGSKQKPCLSLSFYVKEMSDKYGTPFIETANLNNIESLDECIEQEVSDEIQEKYPFGRELLEWVIHHLHQSYPYIKHIKLSDNSYIPCNRKLLDVVDLLTYSIAHYGKTWYEQHYNAYLSPESKMSLYKEQVAVYSSPEFKSKYDWNTFLNTYATTSTDFAFNLIKANYDSWETIYTSSATFPEFFRALRAHIPKQDKCMFYKSWLEAFIKSVITIYREWTIDISPKKGGRRKRCSRTKRRVTRRI